MTKLCGHLVKKTQYWLDFRWFLSYHIQSKGCLIKTLNVWLVKLHIIYNNVLLFGFVRPQQIKIHLYWKLSKSFLWVAIDLHKQSYNSFSVILFPYTIIMSLFFNNSLIFLTTFHPSLFSLYVTDPSWYNTVEMLQLYGS